MGEPARYHPLLAALHWVIGALIVAMLVFGFAWMAQKPQIDRQMIGILGWHMAGGGIIFVLMAYRLICRLKTNHPAKSTIGHRGLDRLALLSHYGFYGLILLLSATGAATAITSNLAAVVFGDSTKPMPSSFTPYPTFAAHALLATALAILIVLHVLAALYHQIIRKDRLLSRMSLSGSPVPRRSKNQ